jgi:predicted ATP-grasp superfamily ATP-dependent carboligase
MLSAVALDFLALPDTSVHCSWDSRFPPPPPLLAATGAAGQPLQLHLCDSPETEARCFDELCRAADQILIIAPEFEHLLARRVSRARQLCRGQLLNASEQVIELCGDKLALAGALQQRQIATIPTIAASSKPPSDWGTKLVLKPRYGAGSVGIRRLTRGDLTAQLTELAHREPLEEWIIQPDIPGRSLSIALVHGRPWPVAEQHLSDDGTCQYLGGLLPAQGVSTAAIDRLARQLEDLLQLSGQGYVGCDLIQTADHQLVLVEINPRLTTSYVGYRQLAGVSLAPWLIEPAVAQPLPPFREGQVTYSPDGTCTWTV